MILEDKVVVVTGVGPGLGRSMALAAAEEGARVVCMARTEAFVAKVVDEITGQGGEALAVPGDITSTDDCARWCRRPSNGSVASTAWSTAHSRPARSPCSRTPTSMRGARCSKSTSSARSR